MKRGVMLVLLLSVLAVSPDTVIGEISCDVKREMLELLLAMERYRGLVVEVVGRRVALADGVKAGNDFKVAQKRFEWVCGARLKQGAAPERRMLELIATRVVGFDTLLVGKTDLNHPSHKAGQEAALELNKLASEYFSK